MRNLFAKLTLLVIVVLASSALLLSQDSSSMTGVVTDPTGAVIPGTVVTLSNPSTGVSYTQTTDSLGTYRFLNVPAGKGYKATFSHDGFAVAQISDVTLSVGITRTQSVILTVGGTSTTVAVSAGDETVTLNTTDATIGNNIQPEQLNQLPVYDRTRGISTLFYAQPGVDYSQGAVTGARIDQSETTVDGLDNDDQATGQTFYLTTPAPVDSVDQFTGSIAGLGSGIGTGSGGQFQLVTKSGTNKFHGNANEYHRDTDIVANPWFNNLNGLKRTPLIQNQFGAAIGGPIKRDKLFFFFNWAASRIVQSSTSEPIVPLPASYGGLLAGTLNYINDGTGCDASSKVNTAPACISTLSAAQIKALDPAGIGFSPDLLTFIKGRYPEANDLSAGDGVNTGGYIFTYPTPNNNANYIGKIDYNLTPTQKIFGRFTINRQDRVYSVPQFPKDPNTHPFTDRSYSYVVGHTWNIGNNKVNQAYYGDQISKLSFPDIYNPTGGNQFNNFSGLDGPYTDFDGQQRRVPVPMVRDDFSWQRHNHTFTFGGTFKFIKTNSNLISDFNYPYVGLYGAGLSNGLGASLRPAHINASTAAHNDFDQLFALGLGVIGQIDTNYSYDNKGHALPAGAGTPRAYRFFQTEAYFGDNWKLNRKLTINYGVRYQLYSVPYETKGFESVPSPIPFNTMIQDRLAQSKAGNTSNTGLPIYSVKLGGKANHGPNLYAPNYKDFGPRVGFSFAPYSSQKTVINGSAGIYYDRTVIDAIDFLQDQISYLFFNSTNSQFGTSTAAGTLAVAPRIGANLGYSASLNPAPQPITVPYVPYVDSTGVPYGLGQGQTNFVISPTLKDPYSIVFNFGVQQDLPAHMILRVNYVGRLGRRLIADADAGQVIDVPDYTHGSTQSMAQAFAGLTKDLRAGKDYTNATVQPWFEDVLAPWGTAIGYDSNTALIADNVTDTVKYGDIADALYTLGAFGNDPSVGGFGLTGLLPTNIGLTSQFGSNTYLTNMGNSNYHGFLITIDKNMSQGLQFTANYTWSHSIDNTSVSANANALFTNSNFICDVLYPRACRGDSDFDVRQELNSNFRYEFPFGRGKQFMSSAPRWADEAFGGWEISGLPVYRTGLALTAASNAFLASFDNMAPAIFTGNKSDLKASVNVNHTTKAVYMFQGGSAGALKVNHEFRGPIGIEYGQRNNIRGPGAFYLDAGLGKKFPIIEDKLALQFRADAFNVLNHPNFGSGARNIVNNQSSFGRISSASAARVAQFSLRLEF